MKKGDLFLGSIRKCINYYSKSESLYYYIFDSRDVLFPFSSSVFDIVKKRIIPSSDIYYEDALFKRNTILLRIGRNQFIDLSMVNSIFDIYKAIFYFELYDYHKDNLIMPIFPYERGSKYVDFQTLQPYFPINSKDEKISIKRLIKEKIDK